MPINPTPRANPLLFPLLVSGFLGLSSCSLFDGESAEIRVGAISRSDDEIAGAILKAIPLEMDRVEIASDYQVDGTSLSAPLEAIGTRTTSILDVPYVSQPSDSNWCWAAAGEMISTYLGVRVPTEDQIDVRFDHLELATDSPVETAKRRLLLPGWPDLDQYGINSDFSRRPLSFERIRKEIETYSRPLAWGYSRGEKLGHMVVIVGCQTMSDGTGWLLIINPNSSGAVDRIPYESYASTASGYGRHLRTYFNYTRTTTRG